MLTLCTIFSTLFPIQNCLLLYISSLSLTHIYSHTHTLFRCGLVALSMVSLFYNTPNSVSRSLEDKPPEVDSITWLLYLKARSLKFTSFGEIFSAQSMVDLIQNYLELKASLLLNLPADVILQYLFKGLILIP